MVIKRHNLHRALLVGETDTYEIKCYQKSEFPQPTCDSQLYTLSAPQVHHVPPVTNPLTQSIYPVRSSLVVYQA